MNDATIRLDDLRRLTVLLPDTTPPRAVSAVAEWAVKIRPAGETLTLDFGVAIDGSGLDEIVTRFRDPVATDDTEAGAVDAVDDGASDLPPVSESIAEDGHAAGGEPPAPVAPPAGSNLQASPWTAEDCAELLSARSAGRTFGEIGEELGRSAKACEARFRKLQVSEPKAAVAPAPPAPTVRSAPKARPNPVGKTQARPVVAAGPSRSRVAELVAAMTGLDESFEPADDKLLVDQRYVGAGLPGIAVELGCDEDAVRARWRAILKCGVENAGGIVTPKGWDDLRAAVARRAAEA